MPGKAAKVVITERQQQVLQRIVKRPSSSQQLVQRAKMILLAFERNHNQEIAVQVGCERHAVGVWRTRWKKAFEKLIAVECGDTEKMLESAIIELLSDQHRSGTKPKFTSDQVAQIIAIACEQPDEESERPVTHWTPRELADEAVKRGIVDSISPSRIGHFLKERRHQASSSSLLAQSQA